MYYEMIAQSSLFLQAPPHHGNFCGENPQNLPLQQISSLPHYYYNTCRVCITLPEVIHSGKLAHLS